MSQFLSDEALEGTGSRGTGSGGDFLGFEELEDTTPRRSSLNGKGKRRLYETSSSEEDEDSDSVSEGDSISEEEEEVAPVVKSTQKSKQKRSVLQEQPENRSKKSRQKKQTSTEDQPASRKEGTNGEEILQELRKNNEILTSLVGRVKKTELRLKSVESDLKKSVLTASGSRSLATTPSRRRSVPDEVRRETRRVYHILLEEDIENFEGWKIEPGVVYHDPQNELIVDRLIREVKALNPTFVTQHIKDAAYRYYLSCNEAKSAERRGKLAKKKKKKRKHERIVRKLQERKAAFEKATFKDPQEKEKWKSLLKMEVMSSDESDHEDDKEVIIAHPLPWLSTNVVQFKKKLDDFSLKGKSPQSRRQMKERLEGSPSLRPQPKDKEFPSWVFNN